MKDTAHHVRKDFLNVTAHDVRSAASNVTQFKNYLSEARYGSTRPVSKITIKNYLSDINHFIRWFEKEFRSTFSPELVTPETVEYYRKVNVRILSAASIERHLSSLRKFFKFLVLEGHIGVDPLRIENLKLKIEDDPYRLKDFKNFLYVYNASALTIKNYIIDIKHFLKWAEQVTKAKDAWNVEDQNLFKKIDAQLIIEYKNRLIQNKFSPRSVNRKLSSLRKYLNWLTEQGYIRSETLEVRSWNKNLEVRKSYITPQKSSLPSPTSHFTYSRFPPLRLIQKSIRAIDFLFEALLINPLVMILSSIQHLAWIIRGKPVFSFKGRSASGRKSSITNLPKAFFAPFSVSTTYLPFHKKLFHHLKYTRPKWYKIYHSYSFTHYIHLAILTIFMSALGFAFYDSFSQKPPSEPLGEVLAAQAPLRLFSFQGRLTDVSDNPITTKTDLRFGIYDAETASGSALKWQEVQTVTPDSDGVFSVLLGKKTALSQSTFINHAGLWLGVTVGKTPELTPRQQIASVAFAQNSDLLQGLPPITQSGAGTTNVVLALNSSGNLSIGGTATPTFEASGGKFTLSGKVLTLTTVAGTDSNIELNPDDLGKIDLQKPIQNSTNNNNVTTARGAVEIDDLFAILATSSGQSAFTINQNAGGPIISASSSGTARFTLSNAGAGTFVDDLAVNGGDLTSTATTFNLVNATATTLNIGGAGTAINIGASTGTTTIGNNLALSGADADLTFSGTGNHDITASAGTLRLGATTWTADILASTGGIDLASSTTRLGIIYADEVNATTLVGTLTGGNLTAATFTINSDNATADTEDSDLVFERGTVTPNAQIKWDSTNDEIDFNAGIHLSDTISPVSGALLQLDATGTGTTTNGLIISQTSTGTITNAINVSDETITNAISVGANTILGTTANIDLTNFDVVGSSGNTTIGGTLGVTGLITASGGLTLAANQNLTFSSGTGTYSQTFTGTTTNPFAITASAITTGNVIDLSNTSTAATSSDLIQGDHTATYTAATTVSGNLLDLSRSLTINAAATTLTVNSPVVTISSNCTQTAGTCTDSGTILSLTQSFASGTGAVLNINNSGTGADIAFNTTPILRIGNTGSLVVDDGINTLLTIADGGTVGNVTVSGTLTSSGAFTASSTISAGGNLTFSTDNSFDIGAAGATRPRDLHLARSLRVNSTDAAAIGTAWIISDNASSAYLRVQSGGSFRNFMYGRAARGTLAAPTASQAGDIALSIEGELYDGAAYAAGSAIRLTVGTSAWTTTSHPSEIQFWTVPSGSTTESQRVTIDQAGNVGIGTTPTATQKLVVKQSGDGGTPILVTDNIDGMIFQVTVETGNTFGIWADINGPGTGNALCHTSQTGVNNQQFVDCTSAPSADYAEMYPVSTDTEYGDVVATGGELINTYDQENGQVKWDRILGKVSKLIKTTKGYQENLIGVVSNNYGDFTSAGHNIKKEDNPYPVALNGRVPVKVSLENGEIKTGDKLTSSGALPGFAMKATKAGRIIGTALQDFKSSDCETSTTTSSSNFGLVTGNSCTGKIMVFVNVGYYDPTPAIVKTAEELKKVVIEAATDTVAGAYIVKDEFGDVVTRSEALASAMIGNLRAGLIEANEVISNSILVNRLEAKDEVLSPLVEADTVRTNVITPLSSEKVVIKLEPKSGTVSRYSDSLSQATSSGKPKLEIQNASGSAVASIDDEGNVYAEGDLSARSASFSGTVNSFGLVSETASISGTLRTKNLIAENIESSLLTLKDQVSSLSGSLITNDQLPITNYADIASYSAQLAYVDTLNAQVGTFMQGLFAVGPSSLSDATVFGQLSVGNLILVDNSINVLGSDLQIQPLGLGGVSIAGGNVYIDASGNLSTSANISVGGTLFANVLSPIPGSDLVVNLASSELASSSGRLIVKNASGSAVLTINNRGDITASGSAKFNDLLTKTVSIVREAQADTSLNETIASSSAGFTTITAGEVERTIITPFVKESSLIYITPTSDTQGETPYIARQTVEDLILGTKASFTIGISKPQDIDIKLNWWIIN